MDPQTPSSNEKSLDEQFMKEALLEAEKAYCQEEVPIGAVLVKENQIISRSFNQREIRGDPTAHAEITALREGSVQLGHWRLHGTTLYVTLEPCPMCAGALLQARVSRLVYGASDPKGGAVVSLYQLLNDPRFNHQLEVRGGVEESACSELLRSFFQQRR